MQLKNQNKQRMGKWLELRAVWGEVVPETPMCEGKSGEREVAGIYFSIEGLSRYLKYISFSPSFTCWSVIPGLFFSELEAKYTIKEMIQKKKNEVIEMSEPSQIHIEKMM